VKHRTIKPTALAVVALAIVVLTPLVLLVNQQSSKHITATFASTTSLNAGAKVKVLGVEVGTVTSIKPVGTAVRVSIDYDRSIDLPADVRAVVVPPSIVGDRFVQLGPAYDDGPVLADSATLGLARTGIPVELDQVYRGIDDLSVALGPNGANREGALSNLISASAESLEGNGQLLNDTIRNLAGALGTLAGSSDSYAGTLANTSKVTRTLAGNDKVIGDLVRNLALVSVQLSGQRTDIKNAVTGLNDALRTVDTFTRNNSSTITRTVANLRSVSRTLASHKDDLAEQLDVAPVGLTSLLNIVVPTNWDPRNPGASSPDGRTSSLNLRAALLNNLDTQLGQVLTSVCANLPAGQAAQLAPLCTALLSAGGNLGSVLNQALGSGS
jgi:phospholipid/cholesterol/gamma-HCH transport system substrate-binding protein